MGCSLGINGSSYLVMTDGTEKPRRQWFPRYASGEIIAEACFTAPQSGSDVAVFRTDVDTAIINFLDGSKIWITNGNLLSMVPVVCKADSTHGAPWR
jgi:alkylation response protein AidB-like acyl-CoA dehydrogenase